MKINEKNQKKIEFNEDWEDLLWHVRLSVRYHFRRVRFYDSFNTWTNVFGVFFGSATVVSIWSELGAEWVTVLIGFFVTFFFAVDLVIGSSKQARLHNDLAARFINLERLIELGEEPNEKQLRHFRGEVLTIQKDEPPPLKALVDVCHNEMILAMGYNEDKLIPIHPFKKKLANFFSFEPNAT